MLHRQNIADFLKAYIESAATPDQRRDGMRLLRQFENPDIPWDAGTFNRLLAGYPAVTLTPDKLLITSAAAPHIAADLLRRYLEAVAAPVADIDRLLTTDEAAAYASQQIQARGKSIESRGVLKYIRNPDFHLLRGTNRSNVKLFTRAEVDDFIDWYISSNIKRGPKPGSKESPARRPVGEQ